MDEATRYFLLNLMQMCAMGPDHSSLQTEEDLLLDIHDAIRDFLQEKYQDQRARPHELLEI